MSHGFVRALAAGIAGMVLVTVVPGCSSNSKDPAPATVEPVMACTDLASIGGLPAGTTITSVSLDAGGGTNKLFPDAGPEPENCVVEGQIDPYTGVTDPDTGSNQYATNFELRLPTQWTRRFFFQGGGGTDGQLFSAYGVIPSQAGNLAAVEGLGPSTETPALWRGFAVASTDMGHQSLNLVAGFGMDPTARVNYGYAAIGTVTAAAKAIIGQYFGLAPRRSYFLGCSKGGQEAMQAAQKYGDQFDGIVAGDPGFRLPHAAISEAWNTQVLATAAQAADPTAVDANGNPLLYKAFSSNDLELVRTGVLKACDGLDGVDDGMIFNTQACLGRFDPATLQCSGAKKSSCLSAAQVTALKAIAGGTLDSQGHQVYPGFPYDTDLGSLNGWVLWDLGLPLGLNLSFNTTLGASATRYVFTTPPDPAISMFSVNIDAYEQAITATSGDYSVSAVDFMEATSTDLDALLSHGGKLIITHGASDPVFSVSDSIDYYDQLSAAYGSKTQNFARLFVVPGMNHCAGGAYTTDDFDTLDAIVGWVEQGKAPAQLLAAPGSPSTTKLPESTTRPLCPYPKFAKYLGKGDINDAANYSCVAP